MPRYTTAGETLGDVAVQGFLLLGMQEKFRFRMWFLEYQWLGSSSDEGYDFELVPNVSPIQALTICAD